MWEWFVLMAGLTGIRTPGEHGLIVNRKRIQYLRWLVAIEAMKAVAQFLEAITYYIGQQIVSGLSGAVFRKSEGIQH